MSARPRLTLPFGSALASAYPHTLMLPMGIPTLTLATIRMLTPMPMDTDIPITVGSTAVGDGVAMVMVGATMAVAAATVTMAVVDTVADTAVAQFAAAVVVGSAAEPVVAADAAN